MQKKTCTLEQVTFEIYIYRSRKENLVTWINIARDLYEQWIWLDILINKCIIIWVPTSGWFDLAANVATTLDIHLYRWFPNFLTYPDPERNLGKISCWITSRGVNHLDFLSRFVLKFKTFPINNGPASYPMIAISVLSGCTLNHVSSSPWKGDRRIGW